MSGKKPDGQNTSLTSTQKVVCITSNWQHGFFCTYSFHIWFPDTQIFLWMETTQQERRGKMTEEENLRKKHRRRQAIRIEIRGIGRKYKV